MACFKSIDCSSHNGSKQLAWCPDKGIVQVNISWRDKGDAILPTVLALQCFVAYDDEHGKVTIGELVSWDVKLMIISRFWR
jgi:hypothetical protein